MVREVLKNEVAKLAIKYNMIDNLECGKYMVSQYPSHDRRGYFYSPIYEQ